MLDQAFIRKVRELGEKNEKRIVIDPDNFDTALKEIKSNLNDDNSSNLFCIGNTNTINSFLCNDNSVNWFFNDDILEDDVLIFGKKTNFDKPGVVVIIQEDEYGHVVYNVEQNILNLKANIFAIGFFPEKCYFTIKLCSDPELYIEY